MSFNLGDKSINDEYSGKKKDEDHTIDDWEEKDRKGCNVLVLVIYQCGGDDQPYIQAKSRGTEFGQKKNLRGPFKDLDYDTWALSSRVGQRATCMR
jgi:hypothetical protein